MNATVNVSLETLLPWGASKQVETKFGTKMLRKAEATPEFWTAWRSGKDALKAAGISCRPKVEGDPRGPWEVCWWQAPSAEVQAARLQNAEASRATDAVIDVPAPDGLAYMPFQRAGIAWVTSRAGGLIGDEMGLGKTIQAIGVVNSDPKGIRRILIVCPLTLIGNWRRELQRWLVDQSYSIGVATGQTFPSADIVLINYDVLSKWPRKLEYFWDLVILDEAHMIKNRKTKRAQALIGRKPSKAERAAGAVPTGPIPAKRKLVLTGTPFENRPDELWTLLHFLDPKTFGSYWKFAEKYCGIEYNGFGTKVGDGKNLEQLNRMLRERGYLLRRLKKDVLTELPPKTRVLVELEIDETCAAALNLEQEAEDRWGDDFEAAEADLALAKAGDDTDEQSFEEAVKRIREAKRMAFEEIARIRHQTAVAKLGQAIMMLKDRVENVGPKLIVFAHHHDVLEPLHREFPNSVLVTGDTKPEDRDAAMRKFQTDPACGPFFGSIRASGQGITLTASSHVIFVEEDWVPGRISQAEDRAHRIGQKDNVLVEHFILPGSIDSKMAKTHVRKQEIADKALDEVQAALIRMTPVTFVKWDVEVTREGLKREAEGMKPEVIAAVHRGLQILAGVCDYAAKKDDCGFNGCDARIGHDLANRTSLTPRQAALGAKILRKYHRQLPDDINEAVRGKDAK